MGDLLRQRLRQRKFESPAHEALLALLVTASQLESEIDRLCAGYGISLQQYNILRILRGAETDKTAGKSCGEIAERMIDRSPDVTRRIDSLVKSGLAERDRSDEDRRVVITRITRKGAALLDKMQPEVDRHQEKVTSGLSPKDCTELTRLCEIVLSNI